MSAICQCCGYDIEAEQPVTYGRLSYLPRMGVLLDGKRMKMPPQSHELLGTLMRARGTYISRPALEDRMDWSDHHSNLLAVRLSHIRASLRFAGLPVLIETCSTLGVRFNPAALLDDETFDGTAM